MRAGACVHPDPVGGARKERAPSLFEDFLESPLLIRSERELRDHERRLVRTMNPGLNGEGFCRSLMIVSSPIAYRMILPELHPTCCAKKVVRATLGRPLALELLEFRKLWELLVVRDDVQFDIAPVEQCHVRWSKAFEDFVHQFSGLGSCLMGRPVVNHGGPHFVGVPKWNRPVFRGTYRRLS